MMMAILEMVGKFWNVRNVENVRRVRKTSSVIHFRNQKLELIRNGGMLRISGMLGMSGMLRMSGETDKHQVSYIF